MRQESATNDAPTRASGILTLKEWLKGRSSLMRLYRGVQSYRERRLRIYAERLAAKAKFPSLPVAQPRRREPGLEAPVHSNSRHAGVNLFAYFRGQFGLGEAARLYAGSLMDAGYPVSLNDIDIELPHSFEDSVFSAHLCSEAPYSTNLIFVNPDYFDAAVERIGRAKMEGRHVIACWFWELEDVPVAWLPALEQVDEIMVASTFVERAFRKVTDKPIIKVPLPLAAESDSGLTRTDFGLGQQDFIFLTSFDFHSWIQRKNPFAVIAAFRAAFPEKSLPVMLLIKTSNGAHHPKEFAKLLRLAKADPRIVVRDAIMDRSHMRSLQRCCDVYVSLHRAEGFGLGLAECMELAKPVIATAWSGNLDFMSEDNSCLVPYRLVEIGPDQYLHGEGQVWAEVDTDVAARHMRRLFADREHARHIGNKAAADVARLLSSQNVTRRLIDRLDELSTAGSLTPAAAIRPKDVP